MVHGILSANSLDVEALAELTSRPPLFAPHDAPFWNDPHISRQMLAAHLDPNTDAASRRPDTIERTVAWLIATLGLEPGDRVLDLGCGPGLYCERLARQGLRVTGVDFSPNSIAFARAHAHQEHLDITYVLADYTGIDFADKFDAALLIYYDLGVLPDSARDEVIRRAARALRPGGAFAFDLYTPKWTWHDDGEEHWEVCQNGGFWKPGPYLELTRYFTYPGASAEVRQTVIVEAGGGVSRYRIWERAYTPATIEPVLSDAGLRLESVWEDLVGSPYTSDSPAMGIVARK